MRQKPEVAKYVNMSNCPLKRSRQFFLQSGDEKSYMFGVRVTKKQHEMTKKVPPSSQK